MNATAMKKYFKEAGAFLDGHFILSSGLHSSDYVQCAAALKNPKKAEELGIMLKKLWKGDKPDLVLSPAMGGLIIGHETAKAFGVDFIFTERKNGKMVLRRGFQLNKGIRIIIVEDVFTTGKSTMETYEIAKSYGANVLGALSIVNRMGSKKFYFPHKSLLKIDLKVYNPIVCPLCEKGLPLKKPGSRN